MKARTKHIALGALIAVSVMKGPKVIKWGYNLALEKWPNNKYVKFVKENVVDTFKRKTKEAEAELGEALIEDASK